MSSTPADGHAASPATAAGEASSGRVAVGGPRIVTSPVTRAVAGRPFSYRPRAAGGTPMRWSLARGPRGMAVSRGTGAVRWTPAVTGAWKVTLLVRTPRGSARQSFTLRVVPLPAPGRAAQVILAAGDIAWCGGQAEATARILDTRPGATVVTLGDNAYDAGSPSDFASCYAPTWGRHRARTRPSPGNHDYGTPDAAGYFGYFGPLAGPARTGYYSFDLGAWHVVSLNSERDVGAAGAQVAWLRSDLAATSRRCVLAYWHKPRFTAGAYRDFAEYEPFWRVLHAAGAEIVLNGHDHNYQRYRPMTPSGDPDPAGGIRQFVVGTGGRSLYRLSEDPRREAASASTAGVLELTLHETGYNWRFIPAGGGVFTDSGTGACR